MADKVRVAFIGTGGIAHWQHLKNLRSMPDVELIGYFDANPARSQETAREYGGRAFPDLDALLGDSAVDAVYICLPPFAHGEAEEKTIAAGKPFFLEKPIERALEPAERIAKLVAQSPIIHSVGYNWRYLESTVELRHRLASGEIIGACGWWCGGRPDADWWRRKEKSGGQHVEQTAHIFDVINYVLRSEPVSVYAVGRISGHFPEPEHTVEDVSIATVRYKNGVAASIWSSDLMDGTASRVTAEFYGINRRYEIAGGTLRCWENEYNEIKRENNPYELESRIFIDAVRTGDPSKIRATYADALITHRVSMAVDRSMQSGQVETI